jgi:hypothetical protein
MHIDDWLGTPAPGNTPRTRHTASISLSGDPEASRDARLFASEFLKASGWPGRLDEALLVVSELVGNAVIHGHSGAHISIMVEGSRLRFDVHDDNDAPARLCESPTTVGGFGLRLVDSVASRWGCAMEKRGKTVWAELQSPAP